MQPLLNVVGALGRQVVLSTLVLAALSVSAHAAAPPRVGILRFQGKGEVDVRVAVTRAVGTHGLALVGARELDEASKKIGKPLTGRDNLAAVAKSLGLAAIVEGRVSRGRHASAQLGVHDATGAIVASETWSARGASALAKSVSQTFWRRIGPALDKAAGRPPTAPAPEARRPRRRH